MFTNDNRRNRRFAAITTVAAAAFLVTTADFAAPKRDNVNGRHRQVDADFVKIVHPATPPSAPGNNDITASGLRKHDRKNAPTPIDVDVVYITRPSGIPNAGPDITTSGMANRFPNLTPELEALPRFVTITPPSPYPGGNHDVTADGVRKHDRKGAPTPFDIDVVYITRPSGIPNSGPDITAAALTATGAGEVSTASGKERTFIQSLDLTSSVRYIGSSTVTASSRPAFADGRAWITLDRDSQDGYVAAAGWTFLLK